jgi:hypothetical protein
MDVLIDKKKMEVSVLSGDKVLKNESIDKETYGNLMRELSGDRVDMLRTCAKLFRPSRYKFIGVKK